MPNHTSGCFVCGQPLKYFDAAKTLTCEICGQSFESNAACQQGHFVCDACHAKSAQQHITELAAKTESKNPVTIATAMMQNPFVNMHGPEHHYIIAAALLAAYKNAGGSINLASALQKAQQRASKVPGGICGMWGSCGAGIGAGIFVSIVTEATPLSTKEWGLANRMTAESLLDISDNGGPRCCKRNTLLSITRAVAFAEKHLDVKMQLPQKIQCIFFANNPSCKKSGCLYYPKESPI